MSPVPSRIANKPIFDQVKAIVQPAPPTLSLRQRMNTPDFRKALEKARTYFPKGVDTTNDVRLTPVKPNVTKFKAYLDYYKPVFVLGEPNNNAGSNCALFGIFPKMTDGPSVRVTFTPTSPKTAYLVEFTISMNPATNDQEWHFQLNTFVLNQPIALYNFTDNPGSQKLSLLVPPLDTSSHSVELHPVFDKDPNTGKIPTTWAWLFRSVTVTEFSAS